MPLNFHFYHKQKIQEASLARINKAPTGKMLTYGNLLSSLWFWWMLGQIQKCRHRSDLIETIKSFYLGNMSTWHSCYYNGIVFNGRRRSK